MPSPCATQTATRPDAAWAELAPTAVRPESTTAKELVNPTSAVMMPAGTVRSMYGTLVLFTELSPLGSRRGQRPGTCGRCPDPGDPAGPRTVARRPGGRGRR